MIKTKDHKSNSAIKSIIKDYYLYYSIGIASFLTLYIVDYLRVKISSLIDAKKIVATLTTLNVMGINYIGGIILTIGIVSIFIAPFIKNGSKNIAIKAFGFIVLLFFTFLNILFDLLTQKISAMTQILIFITLIIFIRATFDRLEYLYSWLKTENNQNEIKEKYNKDLMQDRKMTNNINSSIDVTKLALVWAIFWSILTAIFHFSK